MWSAQHQVQGIDWETGLTASPLLVSYSLGLLTTSRVPLQLLEQMPHLPQQSVSSLKAGRETYLSL